MGMTGDESHLAAAHDIKHIGRIDDSSVALIPFHEWRMLRDIKVGTVWKEPLKALDPCKDMIGIAFDILFLCVVDDIVNNDDHILSHEECIILRAHYLPVSCSSINVAGSLKFMVMISDNRIERNARTHDFLLILLQKVERIPADISKHQTGSRTGEGLCCLAEAFHRLACKLGELLLVPGLRISYRHDGIIS